MRPKSGLGHAGPTRGGAHQVRSTSISRIYLGAPNMDCHVTLLWGHATEGTISYLDVLRCGISNRSTSVRGQNERPVSFRLMLASAKSGVSDRMISFDARRRPRAPRADPREDDGKCAPCPSYPQPARHSLRESTNVTVACLKFNLAGHPEYKQALRRFVPIDLMHA